MDDHGGVVTMNHGNKPWLLPRADSLSAELMGLGGEGLQGASPALAGSGKSPSSRFVALAYVPARRHRNGGGRPDPEGDLIA